MKQWKRLSYITLLLVLLEFSVSCVPYPGYRREMLADPLHGVEFYSRTLDLNSEQLQAIGKVREELRKNQMRRRVELQDDIAELGELTHRPKKELDEAKIMKKVEEIGAIETSLRKEAVNAGLSLAKILSEEQYDRFAEILSGAPYPY